MAQVGKAWAPLIFVFAAVVVIVSGIAIFAAPFWIIATIAVVIVAGSLGGSIWLAYGPANRGGG